LGTTKLSIEQWMLCIACAFALLLVDEVIKFFLRRHRRAEAPSKAPTTGMAPTN